MILVVAGFPLETKAEETLTNGGFEEYPVKPDDFDFFIESPLGWGWQTGSPSGLVEIWGSGFLGVPAYEGIRFHELNRWELYTDLGFFSRGDSLHWSFAHRSAVATDILTMKITDLGMDDPLDNRVIFEGEFSSTPDLWKLYSGNIAIGADSNLRISFQPQLTGGSNSVGNFIDSVGAWRYPVPSPSVVSLLLLSGAFCRRRR